MIALLLAVACSGDCSAQKAFSKMEKALNKNRVEAQTHSHAEGAVQADVDATLSIGHGILVHEQGSINGKPVDKSYEELTTPALRDALLLGFSRIGVLHNLVKISRGDQPDTSGDLRKQLEPHDFAKASGGVAFKLRVQGHEMGDVTLALDPKTHLPTQRTQVVHFPNGDMHVTEAYKFTMVK
jgi:hypothetical protein